MQIPVSFSLCQLEYARLYHLNRTNSTEALQYKYRLTSEMIPVKFGQVLEQQYGTLNGLGFDRGRTPLGCGDASLFSM